MTLDDALDTAQELATAHWGQGAAVEVEEAGPWVVAKVWNRLGTALHAQARGRTKTEAILGLIDELG